MPMRDEKPIPDDRPVKSRLRFADDRQAEPEVKKHGRKPARDSPRQDTALTRSRLRLTDEELGNPKLDKPLRQADKAADKLDKAKARIPKRKALAIARATDEATGKTKISLRFEDKAKLPSKLTHAPWANHTALTKPL